MKSIESHLKELGVFRHGTAEHQRAEEKLYRYFSREYDRWDGNKTSPKHYGAHPDMGPLSHIEDVNSSLPYEHDIEIYKKILDSEYMAYSMAYFGDDFETTINSKLSLEDAQTQKYKLISKRLGVQDGQSILDIGCGFGGYIKYLQSNYNDLQITGINPSATQYKNIPSVADTNSSKTINQPLEKALQGVSSESFDRIVSIGVLEHFNNLALLQETIHTLLKPGGACLHHLIVSIDTIPQFLTAKDTIISDYFPNGHVWPYDTIPRHSDCFDEVRAWFINGSNYWKTLDIWHKNYWDSAPMDGSVSAKEIEYWHNYFMLCKAMFFPHCGQRYGNAHYLCTK